MQVSVLDSPTQQGQPTGQVQWLGAAGVSGVINMHVRVHKSVRRVGGETVYLGTDMPKMTSLSYRPPLP